MASEMFRVMLRMRIRPGMERDFEETWYRIGDTITGHPASIQQWLARSDEEPGVYYVMSDWVSEERFREFERSDEHVVHRSQLHPFRLEGSMVTMRLVYEMRGETADR